jgi:hypothetical protein
MNYNFNIALKNLAGETVKDEKNEDLTVGKLLSSSLVNQTKGDSIKYFAWALKMYNCEQINLDASDIKVLSSFVEGNESLTVLAKAQILELLAVRQSIE